MALMRSVPDAFGAVTLDPQARSVPAFVAALEARLGEMRAMPADAVEAVLRGMAGEYATAAAASATTSGHDDGDNVADAADDDFAYVAPSLSRADARRADRTSGAAFAGTVRRLLTRHLRFLWLSQALLEEEGAHCDVCFDAPGAVLAYAHGSAGTRLCHDCDRKKHLHQRAEYRFTLIAAIESQRCVLVRLRPDEFWPLKSDVQPRADAVLCAAALRKLPDSLVVVGA